MPLIANFTVVKKYKHLTEVSVVKNKLINSNT